jgi:DNA-binding transcriptional regulator YiaG
LDDTVQLQTAWQPLEARDEVAELEQAKLRKELGMPIRLVARGLDLSQEDVALWEQETEARRIETQAQFGNEGNTQVE